METIETKISLDDLDLLSAVLEGFTESLDPNDEDRPAIETLLGKLTEFTDKICSLTEYLTGSDWPENLELTISCNKNDIRAE